MERFQVQERSVGAIGDLPIHNGNEVLLIWRRIIFFIVRLSISPLITPILIILCCNFYDIKIVFSGTLEGKRSGMRKFFLLIIIASLSNILYGGELSLKLNQKEVDTGGKIEKFYVLFSEPVAESKVSGPAKVKVIVRKIIDRKNPLTKLPVNFSINLDGKKVNELTLNDRDGSAVIKDPTSFNAGNARFVEVEVPTGEHTLQFIVSKSAIKGLLIRVEMEEKAKDEKAIATVAPAKQEPSKEKEFVPPLIPPLEPLVAPGTGKTPSVSPTPAPQVAPNAEKKEEPPKPVIAAKPAPTEVTKEVKPRVEEKREEKAIVKIQETKATPPPSTTTITEKKVIEKKGFGDIVIFSIRGGTLLPFVFGNAGGYGELSTIFHIYRGFFFGGSIASYNINKDYLVNDPFTGNAIAKYHLHGVPISGIFGYKYQMDKILTRLEAGAGINMTDIDIRREYASTGLDTINSFQFNLGGVISYITKFGSADICMRYIYSNASNMEGERGFVKDLNTGGLALSIGYSYAF